MTSFQSMVDKSVDHGESVVDLLSRFAMHTVYVYVAVNFLLHLNFILPLF